MLFSDLFTIMKTAELVMYWPGEGVFSAVADLAVFDHLPPDMRDTLGVPAVATSGADIVAAIKVS